jgi:hypothetical protein
MPKPLIAARAPATTDAQNRTKWNILILAAEVRHRGIATSFCLVRPVVLWPYIHLSDRTSPF